MYLIVKRNFVQNKKYIFKSIALNATLQKKKKFMRDEEKSKLPAREFSSDVKRKKHTKISFKSTNGIQMPQ